MKIWLLFVIIRIGVQYIWEMSVFWFDLKNYGREYNQQKYKKIQTVNNLNNYF